MHTLLVSYLPRKTDSYTARLRERFFRAITGRGTTEERDLLEFPPPYFTPLAVNAYLERSAGRSLSPAQQDALVPFDALAEQFCSADAVVLAFPMHNFSLPGLVKLYFDAVMLRGKTWSAGPEGYRGGMAGKKALTLSAAGGLYLDPPNPWDHLTTLARVEFQFLGFSEIETVLAEGMNQAEEVRDKSLARCYEQINAIVRRWYC